MQSQWIGKSEGVYFDFVVRNTADYQPDSPNSAHPPLRVFTTKPETVFGVSFVAISREHELLKNNQVQNFTF